ncbi:MAG: tRNA epoxyqueuosine(34) reductase QueG, partial [Rhodospirillales bacterium]|nr:tRNA epoxyqueuosine(34) reductase QueG [Rhodospirillales bacterium]
MADDIKKIIRERAKAEGFDAVGFAAADADANDRTALARFLALGRAGDMTWLADADGRRGNPKALMPGARTAIVLGAN